MFFVELNADVLMEYIFSHLENNDVLRARMRDLLSDDELKTHFTVKEYVPSEMNKFFIYLQKNHQIKGFCYARTLLDAAKIYTRTPYALVYDMEKYQRLDHNVMIEEIARNTP